MSASPAVCLLAGSVFFPTLFILTRSVSKRVEFLLKNENVPGTSVAIALRFTSTVQAIFAVVVGYHVITITWKDVIYSRSELVDLYASYGVPYMIYDIGAMYLVYVEERQLSNSSLRRTVPSFLGKQWLLVLHHVGLVLICYPLVMFFRNGKGDFFIGCFFLTELSTPALNLRHILIKVGQTGTIFFKAVNVVLLISFFSCRILLFPLMYWAYGYNKGLSPYDTVSSMKAVCHLGCAVICAFQTMWYAMFVKSLLRRRHRRGSTESGGQTKQVPGLENNHIHVAGVGKSD
ncbi:ceramide synthase-like [Diadema setosum]|uniref:ceramide synthase-like n=1 Tax=Diadema setosum TaxID=31175 RepID=UPI003B3BC420